MTNLKHSLLINPSKHLLVFKKDMYRRRRQHVFKTALEDKHRRSLENMFWDVSKMTSRLQEDVLKTSRRQLKSVLKMPWRCVTKAKIFVLIKTSWRQLEDVFWRYCSWTRRFQDVLKTLSQDEDERRLHQDECLLGCHVDLVFRILTNNLLKLQ